METYEILLGNLCDQDKNYWEDLSNEEKNKLVNAYILSEPIEIPAQTEYQRIIFNIMNKEKFSQVDEISIKNLLFQAIKDQIEKDMESKWMAINSQNVI